MEKERKVKRMGRRIGQIAPLSDASSTVQPRAGAAVQCAREATMRRFGLPFLFAAPLIACSSSSDSSPPPDTCSNVPASALVSAFTADPHYCMIRFASGLQSARQLAIAPNGDIFVAPAGQIVALYDNNSDGVSDMSERTTFASVPSGNHGLAITSTHLYASSMTTRRGACW